MNLLRFPFTNFSCEIPRGDTCMLKRLFCLSIYCMIHSSSEIIADHFMYIQKHEGGEQLLS
jgi:hypothetical protein